MNQAAAAGGNQGAKRKVSSMGLLRKARYKPGAKFSKSTAHNNNNEKNNSNSSDGSQF